jgi:lysophospholipase L1-like esterase
MLSDAKRQILSDSLIVLGEIGGNDYNFWFNGVRPREVAGQFIPDTMATIGSSIQVVPAACMLIIIIHCRTNPDQILMDLARILQELIRMGAKTILVPNNFPIGCVPDYLSRYRSGNRADYDEHGCLRWFNDFSQRHNRELRGVVARLSARNPGVKLIYADYFGAAMEFVRDQRRFGIGDPLTACCGGDQQPYHTNKGCDRTARIWGDPRGFASWDGIHMTEKAYEVIAQGVSTGPSPTRHC